MFNTSHCIVIQNTRTKLIKRIKEIYATFYPIIIGLYEITKLNFCHHIKNVTNNENYFTEGTTFIPPSNI